MASRALLLLLILCAACGSDRICLSGPCGKQDPACATYVRCYESTGGTRGSLDSTYGSGGSCWFNAATASACSGSCRTAVSSLRAAFPDAGCQ